MYDQLKNVVRFEGMIVPLRSRKRGSSLFSATFEQTTELLVDELRHLGAKQAVMQLDMDPSDFRLDGTPRAQAKARSPGIILNFKALAVHGKPDLRYEVDTYSTWQENVRALAKGLEALRAVGRYGVTELDQQYTGWKALAAGSVGDGNVENGKRLIAAAGSVRRALAQAHPDLGGAPEDFRDVIAARDAT
jgi:hypothetical protein